MRWARDKEVVLEVDLELDKLQKAGERECEQWFWNFWLSIWTNGRHLGLDESCPLEVCLELGSPGAQGLCWRYMAQPQCYRLKMASQ